MDTHLCHLVAMLIWSVGEVEGFITVSCGGDRGLLQDDKQTVIRLRFDLARGLSLKMVTV